MNIVSCYSHLVGVPTTWLMSGTKLNVSHKHRSSPSGASESTTHLHIACVGVIEEEGEMWKDSVPCLLGWSLGRSILGDMEENVYAVVIHALKYSESCYYGGSSSQACLTIY